MIIFSNGYSGICFELNHFKARFNEKMNFQNVSNRASSWALKQGILTKKMRHDKFRQIIGYLSS